MTGYAMLKKFQARRLMIALLIGALISAPWLFTTARASSSTLGAGGLTLGPAAQGCSTLCFRGPEYYLSRLDELPSGAVLIGGVNFNVLVSTKNKEAMRLALRGGGDPRQQFNRHHVAAQLSLLGAGGPDQGALRSPLSCYGLKFAPVRLSNGVALRPSTTLGELMEQARGAARAGRTADFEDLADFLDLLNSDDSLGGCGTDVGELRVFDLSPNPTPEQLRSAIRAYRRGHIVRLIGGTSARLLELLGVRAAKASARDKVSAIAQVTPAPLEVVAVRATVSGALHGFHGLTGGANANGAVDWQPGFAAWAERARGLVRVGASSSGSSPNNQAWTELQESTHVYGDGRQQAVVNIYRLNDINRTKDWYMVTHALTSTPIIESCGASLFTDCYWPTRTREISLETPFPLSDHGPKTRITETEASFDIGGSLGAEGPQAEVGFGFSWKQESVETTDNTGASGTKEAEWEELFRARLAGSIPDTSTKTFTSYQGAIFEVPEGTKSFPLKVKNHVDEKHWGPVEQDYGTRSWDLDVEIPVYAPVLAVATTTLTIAPGEKGVIPVNALIPHSQQGFPWKAFTNQSWLTVASPNSDFSGSEELEIIVAPGAAPGTPGGVVSINSDPPFAAPSVVSGPLLVNIVVGQPGGPPASPAASGVLLAGGLDLLGNPTRSAEIFDPASGKITQVGKLGITRIFHTATTLANGEVLITGGTTDSQGASVVATAELYHPATGTFTYVNGAAECPPGGGTPGCMVIGRARHTATLLPNGKVLIAGGYGPDGSTLNTAELYDPATQTFTATGNLKSARSNHSAIRYNNDFVMLVGGVVPGAFGPQQLTTSELYYVQTGAFGDFGVNNNLAFPQTLPRLFGSGGGPPIASVGGSPNTKQTQIFGTAGSWEKGLDLEMDRNAHELTVIGSNSQGAPIALVTGGGTSSGATIDKVTDTAELLDTFAGAKPVLLTGKMSTPRAYHTATRLPDGRVFIAGGQDEDGVADGTTDLYQPSLQTFTPGPAIFPRTQHTASLFNTQVAATTTTALASSVNPSSPGQSVTFTATVSAGSGTPAGMVTFKDGGTTIGGASLSGGSATFTTSTLTVGAHTIAAVFEGSASFATSTSAPLTQTVNQPAPAATTTTLASAPNPSTPSQAVTFTVTVSSATGTPTGRVSLRDGGIEFAKLTLDGGKATHTYSGGLNPGPHTITAVYEGTANFATSISPNYTQTVQRAATTTTVSAAPNPSTIGQPVTFTVRVSSASGTPTGSVALLVDGNQFQTPIPLTAGSASFTIATLTAGTHSIQARYDNGGANFADFANSQSEALTQTVNQAATATTLASSVNPSTPGQAVTFTATVTASAGGALTGTVTFRDGTAVIGTAALSGGAATLTKSDLTQGTHTITASYGGDANYAASTSSGLNQVVNPPPKTATATTLATDLNPSGFGYVLRLTATVSAGSGGAPTGSVTFYSGSTVLGAQSVSGGTATLLHGGFAVGTYSIAAVYSGDANFAASTSPALSQVVNKAATTTILASSLNPSRVGQEVTFTANVRSVTGPIPQAQEGAVTFMDGAATLGTAPPNNGVAILRTSALTAGTHTITAVYSGAESFLASTSDGLQQVVNQPLRPTTTVVTSSPNPSTFGQRATFTAMVSASGGGTPTGTVTFYNGATALGTVALSLGVWSLESSTLPVGTYSITAVYNGDATFAPSTSPAINHVVNPAQASDEQGGDDAAGLVSEFVKEWAGAVIQSFRQGFRHFVLGAGGGRNDQSPGRAYHARDGLAELRGGDAGDAIAAFRLAQYQGQLRWQRQSPNPFGFREKRV